MQYHPFQTCARLCVMCVCVCVALASLGGGIGAALADDITDDTTPERAWFTKLKTALGTKAQLGRFGNHEGQTLLWFENSEKPKDKKLVLTPPAALMESKSCADAPPDAAKALKSEDGWWLFESTTLAPIALQLSFDSAAFWRYDTEQKCLVRWQVPSPILGTEISDVSVYFFSINEDNNDDHSPKPELQTKTFALWTQTDISLPIHKNGTVTDVPLSLYIGEHDSVRVYISDPFVKGDDGVFILPDPATPTWFTSAPFFKSSDIIENYNHEDEDASLSVAISKNAQGSVFLIIKSELLQIQSNRMYDAKDRRGVLEVYQWNPDKKVFQKLDKQTTEEVDAGEDNWSSESTNQIFSLSESASIISQCDKTHTYLFETDYDSCETNYEGGVDCRYYETGVNHSKTITWTLSLNADTIPLITLKPNDIITPK